MAMDFPNSPSVGQAFSVDDKTWLWDGTSWNLQSPRGSNPHAITHGINGNDPVTIAQSQVTGLSTTLNTKVSTTSPQVVTFCTSTTRPASPTPGQIIYETDTSLYFGWNGTIWSSIGGGGAAYQTSAPSNPLVGALWVDSDGTSDNLNSNDYKLKADAILDQDYTFLQSYLGVM